MRRVRYGSLVTPRSMRDVMHFEFAQKIEIHPIPAYITNV